MTMSSRLSAAVALVHSSAAAQSFLQSPKIGYVQAWVYFKDDFPDDVITVLDQEWMEGIAHPKHYKGADWMALVGFQRTGAIWVAAGTGRTMMGVPSASRNWKIFDAGTRLNPETWYKVRSVVDFGQRRFKSFSIDGPGIAYHAELSSMFVDYPNYMPFDGASMTYDVGSMRSSQNALPGTPVVYFDDVEGGIISNSGTDIALFLDGFEKQATVDQQPPVTDPLRLGAYVDGRWYLERPESLFTIEAQPFARSGSCVGVSNTDLG